MSLDWYAFYQSDFQSVYALWIVPLGFLAYRLTVTPDESKAEVPAATRFVAGLTLFFAFETLIDPVATGPFLKLPMLRNTSASSLIPFLFVYLGDLRVLLLAAGVSHPALGFKRALTWALGMALIVPLWAGVGFEVARWIWPDIHEQLLWILYEFGFFTLCIGLARFWIPRHIDAEPAKARYLRAIFGYSATYYSLWLLADLLILVGGIDLGWGLRVLPNQLYYAFWVPFAYWRFFSADDSNADRYESSSRSSQASR